MKVRCLAIGDPHFQVNNVPDTQAFIKKCLRVVEKLKPDFVVVLGDLLHTHEKIHVTPFKLATKFLLSLSKLCSTYLIIGNHDLCNNQQFLTSNHAFNSFKQHQNITVCDRVISRTIHGRKFIFCPYVPPDRFEEALCTLEAKGKTWDDAACIFAHQEFFGCRFNPVMTSTDGDIWPEDYPLVVSGHIHNEQRLQSNIYYTGSSMQHAFGETANKTIALLTFVAGESMPQIQKIDLELRKKKIVYIPIQEAETFVPEPGVSIKLVLRGSPAQFKVFRRGAIFKNLQKLGVAVSFSPVCEDIERGARVEKKSVLDILKELIVDDNRHVQESFEQLANLNTF